MAGGIFGFDPLQAMLMRVQQQPQNDEQYASGGAPPAAPPLAAPTPAPAAGPSGGGGTGFSALLSTLSGAAGNIASGSGLFGDTSRDAETDPSSGAPLGMVRKANGQRMMNLGVMLLAAGGRQSDDSRARILASIPGQLGDPSSQLNEFAKTRLDMAKTKLIERQIIQDAEASRAIGEWAGGGQSTPSGPTPASAAPSANAPVVAATVPGAIGQAAQAATAAAPVPVPTPAPIGSQPLTIGTPATPAPAPAPISAPIPDAHPATPPQTQILDGRPPPPKPLQFGPQTMTEADRLYLKTPNIKSDAKVKYIADRNKEFADVELATPIYRDPQSGMYKQDIYKNGQRTGEKFVKDIPSTLQVSKDAQGSTILEKRAPTGELLEHKVERDPEVERRAAKDLDLIAKRGTELHEEFSKTANISADTYKKLGPIIKDVKENKAYTGTLGPIQKFAVNALASVGAASEAQLNSLISTQRVGNITEDAANQFARMYNGAVVTDEDRNSARKAIGAILTNNKDSLAAALEDMQKSARKKVEDYNDKLDTHESIVKERGHDPRLYSAPKADIGVRKGIKGVFNPATGQIEAR